MYKPSANVCRILLRPRVVVWILLPIFLGMLTPLVNMAQQPSPTLAPGEFIASKIEDIVGIWESRFMGAVAYMQYEADGTFKLAQRDREVEQRDY